RRPQPGRCGTRVARCLARRRPHGLAGQQPDDGLSSTDADGEVRRAGATALELAERVLDDPVLEGVEADHRDPAAGAEHLDGRRERGLELAELVVDGDPERLEDALCGMAVAEARRGGNRGLDSLDELAGPLERMDP